MIQERKRNNPRIFQTILPLCTNYARPEKLLPVGTKAAEVVKQIVRSHPNLEKIFLHPYSFEITYDDMFDNCDLDFLPANCVSSGRLKAAIKNLENSYQEETGDSGGIIYGIASAVEMNNGETLNIPQMDFCCPVNRHNEEVIAGGLQRLGYKGYLLKSGRSYHFWGKELVDENDFFIFKRGVRINFDTLADPVFLDISDRKNFSVLRVLSHRPEKPYEPQVVASW